jgi:hypothetical protein
MTSLAFRLKKAIQHCIQAEIEVAFMGGSPPEDHKEILKESRTQKERVNALLQELQKRERTENER